MSDSSQAGLEQPLIIPVEAYVSEDYARAERDRLWRKVWLQAGRVEDLPEIGSFITFDVKEDSVIVARTASNELKAFHNVCPHRGRRLIDVPQGKRNASGRRKTFVCPFHGWSFSNEGENIHIPHIDDWQGKIDSCMSQLPDRQRDLIKMRYTIGKSVNQMAEDLKSTANSIAQALFRARNNLTQCVKTLKGQQHE